LRGLRGEEWSLGLRALHRLGWPGRSTAVAQEFPKRAIAIRLLDYAEDLAESADGAAQLQRQETGLIGAP
jgi:hypothetical protein